VVTFSDQDVAGLLVVYAAKLNWKPNDRRDLQSECVCVCVCVWRWEYRIIYELNFQTAYIE